MNIELVAFERGLRRIDEGGLNRIMHHAKHGMIVISANRSEIYSDDPDVDLTPKYEKWCEDENKEITNKKNMDTWLRMRNNKEDQKLHDELKASEYAFTPVYGGYKGDDNVTDNFEPSYIVYCHAKGDANAYLNFDKLFQFALHLTKEYGQESVYIQMPNNVPPFYVDRNGQKTNKKSTNNFKFNDITQTYFTTAKREKRTTKEYNDTLETNPQRFTADISFESMYRKAGPSTYFNRMKRMSLGEVFLD